MINFLNLTISRVNSKLKFSIFNKPPQTDIIINKNSLKLYHQNVAAYKSMIHRLRHRSETKFTEKLYIIM